MEGNSQSPREGAGASLLADKRLLITGVLTKGSIAYSVAERAQQEGAEIVLTGFGRTRRMTERAAARLPDPPDVLELDVNNQDDFEALRSELDSRWGGLDGALHAIAFAPEDALGGKFMSAPPESAEAAFRTSAYSFKALCEALLPLSPSSFVALDFDASVAWPVYDWMGVAKAALESVSRYLARDLGESGVRVNLVSAGPVETPAAGGIPGFDQLGRPVGQAGADGLGHERSRSGRRCRSLPALRLVARRVRGNPARGRRLPRDGGSAALVTGGMGRLARRGRRSPRRASPGARPPFGHRLRPSRVRRRRS